MEIFLFKVIIFLICVASLNIIREIFYFWQCFRRVEKYEISDIRMIGLWCSISFILTIIFTGIL